MKLRKLSTTYSVTEQIDENDLAILAESGYTDVVCHRPDDEEPGQPSFTELAAAGARHRLRFHHIPIENGVDEVDVVRMADILSGASGQVLGYCRTGYRSELLWNHANDAA
ncbi:MAG: sulfur transferase domain-containing protein [Pseudomonadota bacterium]